MHNTSSYSKQGQFYFKYGPAYEESAALSQQKLCFTATDLEFLIKVLNSLVAQEDCYFVKYSERPRDNMYLGRCFFRSKESVWRYWAKFKNHPKLFCSVQNDEEAALYRSDVTSWVERESNDLS